MTGGNEKFFAILLSLEVSFLVCHIGRTSMASLASSVACLVAFISLCFLFCNMLTANDPEVIDCGHGRMSILFYGSQYSIRSLRFTGFVDRDYLYFNQFIYFIYSTRRESTASAPEVLSGRKLLTNS